MRFVHTYTHWGANEEFVCAAAQLPTRQLSCVESTNWREVPGLAAAGLGQGALVSYRRRSTTRSGAGERPACSAAGWI